MLNACDPGANILFESLACWAVFNCTDAILLIFLTIAYNIIV